MGTPDTTPQDNAAHLKKKVKNLSKNKHNTSNTTPHDKAAHLKKKLKILQKKLKFYKKNMTHGTLRRT
jgi:hypothetical protein